jgi:hypothetical protein
MKQCPNKSRAFKHPEFRLLKTGIIKAFRREDERIGNNRDI